MNWTDNFLAPFYSVELSKYFLLQSFIQQHSCNVIYFGVKPCRRVSSLLRGKDVCGLNLHSWNVSTCYLLCGHLRAAEEKVNAMLLMSDALINRSYQYFKIHCERCCLNHSCMTNNMLDTLYLSYGIMMLSYISWKLNKQQQDNKFTFYITGFMLLEGLVLHKFWLLECYIRTKIANSESSMNSVSESL